MAGYTVAEYPQYGQYLQANYSEALELLVGQGETVESIGPEVRIQPDVARIVYAEDASWEECVQDALIEYCDEFQVEKSALPTGDIYFDTAQELEYRVQDSTVLTCGDLSAGVVFPIDQDGAGDLSIENVGSTLEIGYGATLENNEDVLIVSIEEGTTNAIEEVFLLRKTGELDPAAVFNCVS